VCDIQLAFLSLTVTTGTEIREYIPPSFSSKGRFVFVDLSIITRVNGNKDFEGRTSSYWCTSIIKGENSVLIS